MNIEELVTVDPSQQATKFGTLRWHEIDTVTDHPWLVKGVFGRGGLSVAYGEPGCGKSFLALDLAVHVALGWPWHGHKVERGAVVYVAAEGGDGMKNRVAAFRAQHLVDIDTEVPFALVPAAPDLLNTSGDTEKIIAEIETVSRGYDVPVALVVIDTLSRVLSGGNENAPDDMGALIKNVGRIQSETGAHLHLVHHTGKDKNRGGRGHSSLRGAVDTEIGIGHSQTTGRSTVKLTKQKDGEAGHIGTFDLDVIELGEDEDGDPITSCVVRWTDDDRETDRPGLTGQAKLAWDMLVKALSEDSQAAPASNHIPGHVRVVRSSLWRRYFNEASITDSDKPDTKQKAFKRASARLQTLELIGVWQDWVWLNKE